MSNCVLQARDLQTNADEQYRQELSAQARLVNLYKVSGHHCLSLCSVFAEWLAFDLAGETGLRFLQAPEILVPTCVCIARVVRVRWKISAYEFCELSEVNAQFFIRTYHLSFSSPIVLWYAFLFLPANI